MRALHTQADTRPFQCGFFLPSHLSSITFRPFHTFASHGRITAMTKTALAASFALILVAIAITAFGFPKHARLASQSREGARPVKLVVAPDLASRVAKFKLVHMPFNSKGLSAREIKMVKKLVDASGLLDCIYWRQSDPEGLKLYLSLINSTDTQEVLVRRYLKINGSRFDLIEDDQPFVGTEPAPPGRGFYNGMTMEDIKTYLKREPSAKDAVNSEYTIVQPSSPDKSATFSTFAFVPYHVAFAKFLEPAAKDLREAADLSEDPAFAKFLRLRADALLSDDYYASDIAWLDLQNPKFDVVFAPYETYTDSLLGVKTTYGASVMIRNDAESQKLALYQ